MSKYFDKSCNPSEEDYMFAVEQKTFTVRPTANQIDLYLVGSIEGPEKYLPWFNIINNATENDNITVHISSPGGYLSTSLQIFEALVNSAASVEVSVEGECASGASIVMMAADALTIMPSSYVMIHAYSGGVGGKYNEIMSNSHFSEKWFKDVVDYVYADFLEEDEMTQVLDGKDFYIAADDVVDRFTKVLKKRKARMEDLQKKQEKMQNELEKVLKTKGYLDEDDCSCGCGSCKEKPKSKSKKLKEKPKEESEEKPAKAKKDAVPKKNPVDSDPEK